MPQVFIYILNNNRLEVVLLNIWKETWKALQILVDITIRILSFGNCNHVNAVAGLPNQCFIFLLISDRMTVTEQLHYQICK